MFMASTWLTLSAALSAGLAAAALNDDIPWPMPSDCVITDPQEAYSTASDFITFRETRKRIPLTITARLGGNSTSPAPSFIASNYPDPLGISGKTVTRLGNPTGYATLDTLTGEGIIDVEFDLAQPLDVGRMPYDKGMQGHVRVVSTDFEGWGGKLVPFQRRTAHGVQRPADTGAISANFIQHGCTAQGEPGFPLMRSRVSTWGHGDVYVNGTAVYRNVWMHSMFTERYRDPVSAAIYADDAHSALYSPKECNGKANYPEGDMEMSIVIARNCQDPNPLKLHATTDMDMLLSFAVSDAS